MNGVHTVMTIDSLSFLLEILGGAVYRNNFFCVFAPGAYY